MRYALIILAFTVAACAPKPLPITPKPSILDWTHTMSADVLDIEFANNPNTLRCSAMRMWYDIESMPVTVHACRWVTAEELKSVTP